MNLDTALVLGAMAACLIAIPLLLAWTLNDFKRYLAISPEHDWMDRSYVTGLSNFLQELYDAGYASPWPDRPTVRSVRRFQRRLSINLDENVPQARKFIQQHVALWVFIHVHNAELKNALILAQCYLARKQLGELRDGNHRLRVLAFLKQNRLPAGMPINQNKMLGMPLQQGHDALRLLRNIDMIFREHGYHVSPELASLHRWESAVGPEILDELRAAEV